MADLTTAGVGRNISSSVIDYGPILINNNFNSINNDIIDKNNIILPINNNNNNLSSILYKTNTFYNNQNNNNTNYVPSDYNLSELYNMLITTSSSNNNYSVIPPRRREDIMHPLVYITWLTVFSIMIFIAIFGNLIVMWIVIAHRRMRSVTNYFLVNLSCADLLMSTINCMFNFIYMLHNHWSFGEWYCTVNNFMCTVTVSASVFTLTAITCDRYMAIVRPLQPRMSKKIALVAIAFVWIISCLIGLPSLIYSSLHRFQTNSENVPVRIACTLIWPDGLSIRSQMDFTYQVALMVLSYFVPIALMVWCYYGMGRVLWGSRSIGEMSQRQADSIRSKRKVVKMFIFVMVVFVVCWLPYHAYFIYTHFDRSILSTTWVQHLYLSFYWLAMSNAMVNPLIYYWMNARFRKYFKTAVCGWKSYIIRKTMRYKGQQGNETPVLGRNTHSFSRSDDGEPMYQLSRWFSRRNRNRQTRSTIVRESSKFRSTANNNGNIEHNRSPSNNLMINRRKTFYPDNNGHVETADV